MTNIFQSNNLSKNPLDSKAFFKVRDNVGMNINRLFEEKFQKNILRNFMKNNGRVVLTFALEK